MCLESKEPVEVLGEPTVCQSIDHGRPCRLVRLDGAIDMFRRIIDLRRLSQNSVKPGEGSLDITNLAEASEHGRERRGRDWRGASRLNGIRLS